MQKAHFVVEVEDTGLPMGESDTVQMERLAFTQSSETLLPHQQQSKTQYWSYVHASHQSASVMDQCGNPVEFPGCVVLYQSQDGGYSFQSEHPPRCLFDCASCPCQSAIDHIDQQQYPKIARQDNQWWMVYEYRANVILRRSQDGIHWTSPEEIPLTGIWQKWLMGCQQSEQIGLHPHTPAYYDCLIGSPPGIFVTPDELYIFVGLGQNPGSMGCYRGALHGPASLLRKCHHNPLFVGTDVYGPITAVGPQTNPYFDFRTVSSAEVIQIGDRFYMLYEGVRGSGPGDGGDTQFGLGLARSQTDQIDGPWERFPHNPILVDLPGNVGLGHADLVIEHGKTILYTSLDGANRSRLILVWR